MRVLATLPHYPPRSRVGAWLATHELLKHLVARGSVVHVATELGLSGAYEYQGVTVHGHELPGHMRGDVVLSHLGRTNAATELSSRLHAPHVVMVHGNGPLNGLLLNRVSPALTVFNSRSLAAATSYDGPSMVLTPPVWRERYDAQPGTAVTLVSLTPAKGVDLFYRLAEALPALEFIGVIGGYGEQDVRALPNVTILDTSDDMREVYSRTRILLMPSMAETYGMVGVEAMCAGIPVIAHPTSGLRESLGDAGLFADRDDIAAWIAHLEHLLLPREWDAASGRARALAARLTPGADLDAAADRIEALVKGADRGARADHQLC